MRNTLSAVVAVFLLLALRAPLDAQQIRSSYRFIDERQALGVYAGQLFTGAAAPDVGPRNAPIFGIRYNLRFTGPLSGEAALSVAPSERQVMAAEGEPPDLQVQPTGDLATMNILFAELGLRFHFTGERAWRGLMPYVVGTGGIVADLTGRSAADEAIEVEAQRFRLGPSFAVAVGVGTDVFLSRRLSLRLEARNHILRVPIPGGLLATGQDENQWTNNFGISLGPSLHF